MIHLSENEHTSFPVLKLKTVIVRKSFMSLAICRCSLSGSLAKIRKIHSFISMPSLKHSKPVRVLAFSHSVQDLHNILITNQKALGNQVDLSHWLASTKSKPIEHTYTRLIWNWDDLIFTDRQRSCVKVMFSQASVILSMGWGLGFSWSEAFYGVGYLWSHVRSVGVGYLGGRVSGVYGI